VKFFSKKELKQVLILIGFFVILGFAYSFYVPRLKSWIRFSVIELSEKYLNAQIVPGGFEFVAWPIGFEFKDLEIQLGGNVAKIVAPIHIDRLRFGFQPFSLLLGTYGITEVVIEHPVITVISERSQKKKEPQTDYTSLKRAFKEAMQIPFGIVEITHGEVQVKSVDANALVQAKELSFFVENRWQSTYWSLKTEQLKLKHSQSSEGLLEFHLNLDLRTSDNSIYLTQAKLERQESYLAASGVLKGDYLSGKVDTLELAAKSDIAMESIKTWIVQIDPSLRLPDLSGRIQSQMIAIKSSDRPAMLSAEVDLKQFVYDGYKVGDIKASLKADQNIVHIGKARISSDAGTINIEDARYNIEGGELTQARIKADEVQVKSLLANFKVNVPVKMLVSTDISCNASAKQTELLCQGEVLGKNFEVEGAPNKPSIVALDKTRIVGQVRIDKHSAYTKAEIQIGENSKGRAEGTVEFSKGFTFNYSASNISFKDVRSLAGLKLEGSLSLLGSTEGDSSRATVSMEAKGRDLYLEDFALGNPEATVKYSKGHLYFKEINGMYRTTRYRGDIDLDLDRATISASTTLPFVQAYDLEKFLERKVQLPFNVFATGYAKVSAQGPLDLSKLNYSVESSFSRGEVFSEPFESMTVNFVGHSGSFIAQDIRMKKGKGEVILTGEISNTGEANLAVLAKDLRFEEFNRISKVGKRITGQFQVDSQIRGQILDPNLKLQATANQMAIGVEGVPDSTVAFSKDSKNIELNAKIFGDQINLDYLASIDSTGPFHLKVLAKEWDFSSLMGLLSKDLSTREFSSKLTLEGEFRSQSSGFWGSTGQLKISELSLQRGQLDLKLEGNGTIEMKSGRLVARGIRLRGDNSLIRIQSEELSSEGIDLGISGKIEMGLLYFLTPFLADLSGTMSLSSRMTGNWGDLKVNGSAYIQDGLILTRNLPHAFEKIRADVTFNQDQILLETLRSDFAGGQMRAEGIVQLKGNERYPVKIKGTLRNATLDIPQGVQTVGDADLTLTGEWFPYLLAGEYRIRSGKVTREFETQADEGTIKRSIYLPKSIGAASFEPLRYQIKTVLNSPIQVKNKLVDAQITGHLEILGTTSEPGLMGEITALKGGKLYFRETPFDINTAQIRFEDPNSINPIMYAAASTIVPKRTAQQIENFEVNLLLQGTTSDYILTLQSQPPLPDNEIISLLALGVTSTDLEGSGSESNVAKQSVELGSALFSANPLGNDLKERFGFDVKISSATDTTDNTTVPRVIVSRQWTPRVGTSASRTLGPRSTQDVRLQYQFTDSLSAIGLWEGRSYSEESGDTQVQDVLGLDLEYRVDFR